MRRAALICFHGAAGLSLLFCLAAVGAWGWGQSRAVLVMRVMPHSTYEVGVSRGELGIVASHHTPRLESYPIRTARWSCKIEPSADFPATTRLVFPVARPPIAGFFFGRIDRNRVELTMILFPMWLIVAVFALLPLAAGTRLVRRRRRARRLNTGHCIA
jgi:hypothetical protein